MPRGRIVCVMNTNREVYLRAGGEEYGDGPGMEGGVPETLHHRARQGYGRRLDRFLSPQYRGTSLIRNRRVPKDHPRALDIVLLLGGAVSYERGIPVMQQRVQGYLAHEKLPPARTLQ